MLSIVATPIGNLGDITRRAIETFEKCDAVICEDTRVTGNLLKQLGVSKKPFVSLHSYSSSNKIEELIERLRQGEHLVLASDAGTPGISDPGYALVSRARAEGIAIEVIPGPAAFLAALSGSGLPINQFVYLGFLPLKKGRQTALKEIHDETRTVVLYESVHRIKKLLAELAEALNDQPARPVVIARELTKMHEEFIRTTVQELASASEYLTEKGEFVLVIGPQV
ncbi:MAG TPA: 16S rRNA (cytidine(1402)-2'-O)-methyltransferase [Candidatus Peribacteraceae bacterium]|nr:16S rRNA (cytidine(1402)-2'-O)-methyltransferase [Candidatus Peribacteraceae bacterium]